MRAIISVIFTVGFLVCCASTQGRGQNQGLRKLVLNEQELRFAGSALRTVLGSNVNSYRPNRGARRFSGTFTIIEKDGCGGFEVRIDADVDRVSGGGGGMYRRDYYVADVKNVPMQLAEAVASGYAGQYNY